MNAEFSAPEDLVEAAAVVIRVADERLDRRQAFQELQDRRGIKEMKNAAQTLFAALRQYLALVQACVVVLVEFIVCEPLPGELFVDFFDQGARKKIVDDDVGKRVSEAIYAGQFFPEFPGFFRVQGEFPIRADRQRGAWVRRIGFYGSIHL
nr:hypothetical protein [Massilia sp. JS1662]